MTLDELKQDDVLSNLIFNIVLEDAIQRTGVQRNGCIINKSYMLHGYADDIDIIDHDRRAVEEVFVPFKREIERIELIVNSVKIKYLVADKERGSPNGVYP